MKHFVILNDAQDATAAGRAELRRRLEGELHLSASLLDVIFSKLPAVVRVDTDEDAANKLRDELTALGAVAEVSARAPDAPLPSPIESAAPAEAANQKHEDKPDAVELDFIIDDSALAAARTPVQTKAAAPAPLDMQDILIDLEESPPQEPAAAGSPATPKDRLDELPVIDSLLGFDEAAAVPEPAPEQTAAAALRQEEAAPAPAPEAEGEQTPVVQPGGFQSGVQAQHSAPVNRANLILFAALGLVLIGSGLFYLTGGIQQPTATVQISSDMIETLLLQQQQFARETEAQHNRVSNSLTVEKEWTGASTQPPYTYALRLSFTNKGFFLTHLQITTPQPPPLTALEKVQKKKPPLWLREIVIEKRPNMLSESDALNMSAAQPYALKETAFAYFEEGGKSGRSIVNIELTLTADPSSKQAGVQWRATNLPAERAAKTEEILARSDTGVAINLRGSFIVVCDELIKASSSSSQSVSTRAP